MCLPLRYITIMEAASHRSGRGVISPATRGAIFGIRLNCFLWSGLSLGHDGIAAHTRIITFQGNCHGNARRGT